MKKTEWLKTVSKEAGVKIDVTNRVIKALVKTIRETLKSGETLSISGLGSFRVKPRKPCFGRNLKTGEKISIPGGKKISFKPTLLFRKIVSR